MKREQERYRCFEHTDSSSQLRQLDLACFVSVVNQIMLTCLTGTNAAPEVRSITASAVAAPQHGLLRALSQSGKTHWLTHWEGARQVLGCVGTRGTGSGNGGGGFMHF